MEELLGDRSIRRIRTDKKLVHKVFLIAKRDLKAAKEVFEAESYSWCLAIAYNSMLQAGRALMFSKGFKPTGQYQHVTVIRFLHEVFGREFTDRLIAILDRMRKKRHAAVYDAPDTVSRTEAENSLRWASEFITLTEKILRKNKFL